MNRSSLAKVLLGTSAAAAVGAALLLRDRGRPPRLDRPVVDVVAPYLDVPTAQEVIKRVSMMPPGRFYLLLDTYGGHVTAVVMMLKVIFPRKSDVIAIVPRIAFSGGTMLALCSKSIIAGRSAYFSPVDPQVGQCAANELSDNSAAVLYTQQTNAWVTRLLDRPSLDERQREELRSLLMGEKVPHGWPISAQELQAAGLEVKIDGGLA